MKCYSKDRDKLSGCLSPEACNEVVDDVLDEHLGFDLHELILNRDEFENYLVHYCENIESELYERSKNSFKSARPLFCKFLMDKYEKLRFYTTRRGIDMEYPTIVFLFDEFEGQTNKAFMFIKGGLIKDEQDVI